MGGKVKTSIMIDRGLWEEFKSRVGGEKGLKMLSKAVEEAIGEEVSELLVAEVLSRMLGGMELPLTVVSVKPKAPADAGKAVKELREGRA